MTSDFDKFVREKRKEIESWPAWKKGERKESSMTSKNVKTATEDPELRTHHLTAHLKLWHGDGPEGGLDHTEIANDLLSVLDEFDIEVLNIVETGIKIRKEKYGSHNHR